MATQQELAQQLLALRDQCVKIMSELRRVIKDIDATRPNVPAGLQATPTSETAITLSWSAATDPAGLPNEAVTGVVGYRLYRDAVLRVQQAGLSFGDTGLSAYTTHAYRVSSYDAAGNESIQSSAVNPRTLDTTSPSVPTITATSAGSGSISVALATPSTDAGSGVASYRLEYKRTVDPSWTLDNAVLVPGQFPRVISGLASSTGYDTRCRATDNSANVGSFSATSSATTAQSTPLAGLHVGANSRYLVTAVDQPIYLLGDTVWSIALSLTEAEAQTLMTTRASQGFNTIFMDAVGLKAIISGVSTDRNGNAPFNATLGGGQYDVSTFPVSGDTTTSAGRYWQHVDNLITMAEAAGLIVCLDVYDTYAPWFSSDQHNGVSPNSTAKLQAYGQFLGQRYASRPNLVWVFGNDYQVTATGNTNIATVIDAIRQFDSSHGMTIEQDSAVGFPAAAFDSAGLRSRINVNGIYLYNTGPYRSIYLGQYNRADFGPVFNAETAYELNSGIPGGPTTAAMVRSAHYVQMLCGSCGDLYGNERVGGAFAGGPFAADWQAQLTSQGGREMGHFATFVNSIFWHVLVPDQSGTVFSGVGSPTDYSGARALDGTLAVAYKVPTGSGTQNFVVNKAQLAGPITARWFDPTNGTYTTIGTGIANSGQQTFTTIGNNSAGANDWVLVLTTGAPAAPQWNNSPVA